MWKEVVAAHYKSYVHLAGISVPYKALSEQTLVKYEPTINRTRQACVHQADLFKRLRWKTIKALLSQTGARQYGGFEVLPHSITRSLVLVNWGSIPTHMLGIV